MKKVLSLIIAALTLAFSAQAFAETYEHNKAVEYMYLLSLTSEEAEDFRGDSFLTREEAAVILTRLVCDEPASGAVIRDVSSDRSTHGYIANAVSRGFLSLNDGYFYPLRPVTAEDFEKALLNILGYGAAEGTGAYKSAKRSINSGIGVEDSAEITRLAAAEMILNALDMKMLEAVYTADMGFKMSDDTLLDRYLEEKEMLLSYGVLEATYRANINGDEPCEEGYIVIDSVSYIYDGEKDITPYIGKNIDYSVFDVNNRPAVRFVYSNNNTEYTIDAQLAVKLDDSGFKYEKENTTKTVRFSDDVIFVYNNYEAAGFTYDDMLIQNGSYTLIDNDEDNKIDVVIISEYESFVVKDISVSLGAIYLMDGYTYKNRSVIRTMSDDEEYECFIVNKDGQPIEIGEIERYNSVTVIGDKTEKYINIIVNNEKPYMAPTGFDEDYVIFGERVFRMMRDDEGYPVVEFTLGMYANYIIDAYGNIIGYEETLDSRSYGYVTRVAVNETEDGGWLKLISGGVRTRKENADKYARPEYIIGNADFKSVNFAAAVKLDNKKIEDFNELSRVVGKAVSYKIDEEGNIYSIETLDAGMNNNEKSFNADISAFGGLFYIDDNTKIICCPEDADAREEDYFTTIDLKNGQKYAIVGYDIDEDTKVAKAAVIVEDMVIDTAGVITKSTKGAIVEKLKNVYDEAESELLYEISLWFNGKNQVLYVCDNDAVREIASKLKFGDVIYYSTNALGLIDNIEYVASLGGEQKAFHTDKRGSEEKIFGTLYTVGRRELSEMTNTEINSFGVSLSGSGTDRVDFIVENTATPNMYRLDNRNKTIQAIEIRDTAPFNEFAEDADNIFIAKKNSLITTIITVQQ